ncbi:MAG: hypothetical protein ACFBQW_01100 [Sphingomonadaceae bacterium]
MGDPKVDRQIQRVEEMFDRIDRRAPATRSHVSKLWSRRIESWGERLKRMGVSLGAVIAAAIAFALIVGPLQIAGLFVLIALIFFILVFFSVWPTEPRMKPFKEEMPTGQIVRQLDNYLLRKRAALPPLAARRVDSIHDRLPLLEAKLSEAPALDPLAQDARRLMGRHLPELIERYNRVPAAYRRERDDEGLSVEDRLVSGLDAADEALAEIGQKLAQKDVSAFETQGRFIETRYRGGDEVGRD